MSDDKYCYPPDFEVLRNKLNIRDTATLERAEREFVTARMTEPIPPGKFDLTHLQAIHRHLFQDIYTWAGNIREVEIAKGETQFQHRRFIQIGMSYIHNRLKNSDFLSGLKREEFAEQAGQIIGDLNHVHPFREGNGRTQLVYLKQLALQAGHNLDLSKLDKECWLEASRKSHQGNYDLMAKEISHALGFPRERSRTENSDKEAFLNKRKSKSEQDKDNDRYH